jgi:hypothetical protein
LVDSSVVNKELSSAKRVSRWSSLARMLGFI